MAETIGITSGLVALALFAFNSSVSLYQTIESFKSSNKRMRELKLELEALLGVLRPLSADSDDKDPGLDILKQPVLRCAHACKEFEEVLAKCTEHSGMARTSFRDWTKLMYLGRSIDGFKDSLAGYKATINIAVGGATLRKVAVTAKALTDYKTFVGNTTIDLRDHLQEITAQLETLRCDNAVQCGQDAISERQMQEEKESTKQCLDICTQVSERLEQVRPLLSDGKQANDESLKVEIYPTGKVWNSLDYTKRFLSEMEMTASTAALDLTARLRQLDLILRQLPKDGIQSDVTADHAVMEEEIACIGHCIDICTAASKEADNVRTNRFEDVSAGDDSRQVIVSTLGDLISATRITAGRRSEQIFGQMTDETLRQLSKETNSGKTE